MDLSGRAIFKTGIITAILLLSACSGRQRIPLGEVPAARPLSSAEVSQTRSIVYQLSDETGRILPTASAEHKRVERILSRLARAAGAPSSFPLYVMEVDDDVNAMAVNNNSIVVYSSLLKKVPKDDELATVLSHEIAHILARHGDDKSAEEREAQVSVASTILGTAASIGLSAAGQGGALADIAGDATETTASVIGTGAFVRAYDRELETEADQVGLMLMAKAGYDPQAALRFWEHSEAIFGSTNSFSFLSTHPSSGARASDLERAMPKALEYYRAAQSGGATAGGAEPAAGATKKKKKR